MIYKSILVGLVFNLFSYTSIAIAAATPLPTPVVTPSIELASFGAQGKVKLQISGINANTNRIVVLQCITYRASCEPTGALYFTYLTYSSGSSTASVSIPYSMETSDQYINSHSSRNYYFKVLAMPATGSKGYSNSPYSRPVQVTAPVPTRLDTPANLKLSSSPVNPSAKNIGYSWSGVPSAGRYYLLIGSSASSSCNPNYSPSLSSPLALFYRTITTISYHACAKVQAYPQSTDTIHTKSNFTDIVSM